MRVQVLLFASLSEFSGRDCVDLEIDDALTARDLLNLVEHRIPELSGRMSAVRVAVDHQFRADSDPVLPGSEIALIPPVSGG